MPGDEPFRRQVALITGAARLRGIGRATAVALAELGADIVITGTARDPASFPEDEKSSGWPGIEGTAAQIRERGRRCLPLTADASSGADARRVASAALAEFQRIDILVNNAALARGADRVPLTELSEDLWRSVLEVKLTGSFLMCRAVLPTLIAQGQGGSIVNVSSIAGKRGSPNTVAYCAANAGLQGFTQALAMEVAPHRIRVNAVCPGLTATSRMDSLAKENWDEFVRQHVPWAARRKITS
jgi:NAD(P)-dependent dehydrogenase (short-subunit alcohol dehydrogenase family)